MSNIYNVFNTSTEHEFSKFFDKLNLNTNELLNTMAIAESYEYDLHTKQKKILELMAGTANGNYEICIEQFNKKNKQRVLKENIVEQLNLNQIMELNNLVEMVAKKLQAPNCMKGLYNLIKTKTNDTVAKTFLGMVQQSSVNDSNLKFNTELQVNGQNLAQLIYQLKNDIEMFVNAIECPKKENKEEVTESEDLTPYNRIAGIYDINTNSIQELNKGETHNLTLEDYKNGKVRFGIQNTQKYGKVCYITALDRGYAYQTMKLIKHKYNNQNINMFNLEFRTDDGQKMFIKLDSNGHQLFENKNVCHFTSEEVKQMISEDKRRIDEEEKYDALTLKCSKALETANVSQLKKLLNGMDEMIANAKTTSSANALAQIKSYVQTRISELEGGSPKIEECIAQQVVSSTCGEDTFDGLLNSLKPTVINITVNKEDGSMEEIPCEKPQSVSQLPQNPNYPQPVQALHISPTAIDAPILKKPDTAMATSALAALSSHLNVVKSDSRENNIEELETINTLLGQLANYFNSVLNEAVMYHSNFKQGDYVRSVNGGEYKILKVGYDNNANDYYYEMLPLNQDTNQIFNLPGWKDIKLKKIDKPTSYEPDDNEWDGSEDELEETCSAGATCAANVSGFAKPLGSKPKKRKSLTTEMKLFKESVEKDLPSSINLNGNIVSYRLYDGKGYLYINDSIVKTNNHNIIVEAIEDYYNDCLELPILEGFNHYDIEMLLEDDMDNDGMNDMNSNTVITPAEKQKQEQDLDTDLQANPQQKLNVIDDETHNMLNDQEFVGIDDSDVNNKKYIVKDPSTGKVKVANSTQIKIAEN